MQISIFSSCLQDSDLLGGHFSGIDTSIPDIKRYYTTLYVFKFYNSENVYFQCSVKLCPAGSSACDLVSIDSRLRPLVPAKVMGYLMPLGMGW